MTLRNKQYLTQGDFCGSNKFQFVHIFSEHRISPHKIHIPEYFLTWLSLT